MSQSLALGRKGAGEGATLPPEAVLAASRQHTLNGGDACGGGGRGRRCIRGGQRTRQAPPPHAETDCERRRAVCVGYLSRALRHAGAQGGTGMLCESRAGSAVVGEWGVRPRQRTSRQIPVVAAPWPLFLASPGRSPRNRHCPLPGGSGAPHKRGGGAQSGAALPLLYLWPYQSCGPRGNHFVLTRATPPAPPFPRMVEAAVDINFAQ